MRSGSMAEIPEENEDFSSVAVNRAVIEKLQGAIPAGLQAVIETWDTLPQTVKDAIIAIITPDGKQEAGDLGK